MRPRSALARGLDFLLPPGCLVCGEPSGSRVPRSGRARILCPGCQTRLRAPSAPYCARCHAPAGTGSGGDSPRHCRECAEWPDALDRVRSAVILAPPADEMVHALKYGGWPEAAEPMAREMTAFLPRLRDGTELEVQMDREPALVPIPTTAKRKRRRGYNQADLLAREVAGASGLGILRALRRNDRGGSQVALQRDERRANVQGAFEMRQPLAAPIRGRGMILIDDVLTTGATACEAAEVLAAAGADPVRLLVFARTLPGRDRDAPVAAGGAPDLLHASNERPAPSVRSRNDLSDPTTRRS